MSQEAIDRANDSGGEFERPKDEFQFYYKGFKLEEKKVIQHQKFEDIATRYWQLLRNHTLCDPQKPTISQKLYTELMKRVYTVLLPIYREDEMVSEISQEWLMDSRGQSEMTFSLFLKLLFRIAHQWAIHVDLDEYLDLLNKIYNRIIVKEINEEKEYYQNGSNYQYRQFCTMSPNIVITFPDEEKKFQEAGGSYERKGDFDDWLECRSNESERSEYQYEYREDPDNMVTRKYKKNRGHKQSGIGNDGQQINQIKEPFVFNEEVKWTVPYSDDPLPETSVSRELLNDIAAIYPFGYPTEQFFQQTKQQIYSFIEQWKQDNKSTLKSKQLTFGNFGQQELQIPVDADYGIIDERGATYEERIPIERKEGDSNYYNTPNIKLKLTDTIYNNFRKLLRDGNQMTLRMFQLYPKAGARSKNRTSMHSGEPITEFNKHEYNPALDRRILYKLVQGKFVNIHYLIDLPSFRLAYRSDVQKIENKDKLAIKQSQDDQKRDEDFINVESNYKKTRQIMLQKKFDGLFGDRCNADVKEQRRLKKLIDREEKRKDTVLKQASIQQKGLSETFEEKTFVKIMKGPFYNLDSLEGLREDDFITAAEQDLIDAARTKPLRIFVIGKPRSGKSTLSKQLSLKLDLVHINVENWILRLLEKIKNYEPPEDLEEGQEPPKFLSPLEESIHSSLKSGQVFDDDLIFQILYEQIHSPLARMKGYILDLHFYNRSQPWSTTIRQRQLLGIKQEDGSIEQFSHIIELQYEDQEILLRARNLRVNPEDGNLYSRWEREERRKPKPPLAEGEEEPEEDENAPKPLDELALIHRSNDDEEQIRTELIHYNQVERTALEELMVPLFDSQYIKVDAAGLTPEEVTDKVQAKLKPEESLPLRPIATQIEGASDFKGLLSEGIEEFHIPRTWSLWKQIDPVALSAGKVIIGQPDYAASYHNNAFVFSTEENMKTFIQEPKLYLQNGAPQMPISYKVLMLGPKGVGRHTQAKLLNDLYGWKVVDFQKVVKDKLEILMKGVLQGEPFIPNNPTYVNQNLSRIGLSDQELNDVIEGKPFAAWKYIPWLLDYLGYDLEKKKPPPPEAKEEGQEQEEEELDDDQRKKKEIEAKKKRDEEEKKKKEEEEVQRQKEDRRRRRQEAKDQGLDIHELGLDESEEEPLIIEDLSIDQLVLKAGEDGVLPTVGGFILIGFPETEEHINKLKEHLIEFDRIIYLGDTNEEEPGAEIKLRMKEEEGYDWDWELDNSQRILNLCKDQLNENDIVREISCNGVVSDVLIRIRNEIDPFYLKIDNSDDVRVSADLDEEARRLPKGDFGDYCPVTFVKDHWLMLGSQEQEVTVFGKTYWLAGEKEAEEFKFNPVKFLVTKDGRSSLPLQPPPPKILIVGMKGSGVSTQIRMLCEKFKLDEFVLKEQYLAKLKEEKDKRKRRRLLDRGFRPPLPPDEEGGPIPPDPEIEDDPDEFEKEAHEREVMKQIFNSHNGYVIDGTWADLPEESVGQSLQDLLFESRRIPEIIIILKCKEQSTFKRIIDEQAIKNEYQRLMEIRTDNKRRQREEDRDVKLKELLEANAAEEEPKPQEEIDEAMAQWDEEREAQEEADDENDPEKPNLEEMLEKQREDLRQRREKDEAFLEEFGTAMKEKKVVVIDDIKSDISAEYVFVKLLDRIQDNFSKRTDLIEKLQAQALKPEEVPFYEKSYLYKHSKFGINSPLDISNPQKTKKHTVLYRERLYFLSNQDQQDAFLKEPSKYTLGKESVPLDILIKPKLVVIGLPKSGKSTLCKALQKRTGVVHLKISKIIEQFCDKYRDSQEFQNLRRNIMMEGKSIDDDVTINLLLKRIAYKDCVLNGWILEDFPKTRNQAVMMTRKGIVPTNVFYLVKSQNATEVSDPRGHILNDPFKRSKLQDFVPTFGALSPIQGKRINFLIQNLPHVYSFYQKYYGNLVEIDTSKSIWFMQDKASQEIQACLKARQEFSRDYFFSKDTIVGGVDQISSININGRACKMQNLNGDKTLVKQSLSEFKYYCPVTWKNEKILVKCHENTSSCVLYRNAFYYFRSNKERDMFINNPQRFLQSTTFPKTDDLPLRFLPHKAAEIILFEKALSAHCPVTLIDEERVVKGDQILLIQYKDFKYSFDSEYKLQRFLQNPFKYSKAQLPVQMPPSIDKISLYSLQKMEDSITFMEQALGQIVTKALREVSENRLKYPTLSVKETMLKLFALYLKTENPANTEFMKKKYANRMQEFIKKCEIPEELFDLQNEKEKKKEIGKWPQFKQNFYYTLGETYDYTLTIIETEKADGFQSYIK